MAEQQSLLDLERAAAAAELPPIPEGFQLADPTSPEAMQRIAEIKREGGKKFPLIPDPAPNTVMLAGGIVHKDEVYRQAEVRELNGEDEEYIVRAVTGGGMARLVQAILERGVVRIGPVDATPELLTDLLIGDQENLVLGVRIATYGATMEMDVKCGSCDVDSRIAVDLGEDVKTKKLEWDFRQPNRDVELRNGHTAVIRLAKGSDQVALAELVNKTRPEANSEMLARCLVSVDGHEVNRNMSMVKRMGAADRDTLVNFIIDKQPGPLFGDVKYECTVCRKETPLGLDVGILFPWLA